MVAGVNGRILQSVYPLVVKVLRYRVDLVVNHLLHVVEHPALVIIFDQLHAIIVVVQVC